MTNTKVQAAATAMVSHAVALFNDSCKIAAEEGLRVTVEIGTKAINPGGRYDEISVKLERGR